MKFSKDSLIIDAKQEIEHLCNEIKKQIREDLKKSGAVVGISGGIDSSVVAALSAKAMGKDNVLGVIMPGRDSSPDSRKLAENLASHLGIKHVVEEITGSLEGFRCYQRRDEAIKKMFPEYTPDYNCKITIAGNPLEKAMINYFKLTIESPDGEIKTKRMPPNEYLQIVAASNFKQRTRMSFLYYHAEKHNWAVAGTGNKDEHELGFFVKYGDGGADLKPIAHLYKIQIYQLARELDIPKEIIKRIPTTDTYSAEVTQTDFFFGLEFNTLDTIWYALEHEIPAAEVGKELGLTEEQVERVYRDIRQKQRTTDYLRRVPIEISTE